MQLYVSDFVGDTLLLSTEHIGAYLLLLIALWNAHGELPSDEAKLARVARLTVKRWRKIAVDLLPFFEVDGGSITHHRLTKELRKSVEQSILRANAGARGGSATALKNNNVRPANAAALGAAGLQHAGASPKPYKKEGNSVLKGSGPQARSEMVRVDRSRDPTVWLECERLMGKKAATTDWVWAFPVAVVAEARVNLAAKAKVTEPEKIA